MHLDYRHDLDEELAKRAPRSRNLAPLPLTLAPGHEIMWLGRAHRHLPWLGLVFSAGLHAALLFGFNRPTVEEAVQRGPDAIEVTFPDMPELEEEEPEEIVAENTETAESLEAMAVPSLADIPTTVPVNAFVQQVNLSDMMPKRPDVSSAVTIPQNYRKGAGVTAKSLGDVFSLADLDRRPEARIQVAPQYPYGQKGRNLPTVRVVVKFVVDKEGNVVNAEVSSASHDGFEEAALAGINRWKFRPGMRRGKVVNTRMEIPLLFRITDD